MGFRSIGVLEFESVKDFGGLGIFEKNEDDILMCPRYVFSVELINPRVSKGIGKTSVSSFLAPELRVGWIVPDKYYERVIKMKTLLNLSTASISQIVVARYLKEGGYERHLRKLRKDLKKQVANLRG